MNSQNLNILNLLTVCRKAGMLITGFDPVKNSLSSGDACLVFTSSDASPKTIKEISFFCNKFNVPIVSSPLLSDDFIAPFNRKIAVAAFSNKGFADRFLQLLPDLL